MGTHTRPVRARVRSFHGTVEAPPRSRRGPPPLPFPPPVRVPSRPPEPPAPPPRAERARDRARLERTLFLAGVALATVHLLDVSLAGPDTTLAGLLLILALAAAAVALQPRVARCTRCALSVVVGVLFLVAGAAAHVFDLFLSGPRWSDLTGVGFAVGGLLLVAAGALAALAPRPARPPHSRARRALHAAGWLLGAVLVAQFLVLPLVAAVITTHAVRLPLDGSALEVPHVDVTIPMAGGDRLAGWWVPSRNGAAVLVVHGSGSDRSAVVDQAELVAREGDGVLAIDLPGHGASDGHANLLGGNAQPAITAALDWLQRRRGVDPTRIAGFGLSLGGEVLLEAAARDHRLRAVVSEGADRAADDRLLGYETGLAGVVGVVSRLATRAVSGAREPPALLHRLGAIAPRPVLLIAAGARPHEISVNRAYRRAAGPTAHLWAIPEASHTGGIEARPEEYARRVTAFLDRALGR